ncbi:MAG: sugar transferase [Acidobacteriia bacterium]|nr:sugar transferase [Terriglobia bacterium]
MSVMTTLDDPKVLPDLYPQSRVGPRPGTGTRRFSLFGPVAIDTVLVLLAGLLAYRLRFPMTTLADLWDTLLHHTGVHRSAYLDFLFLYIALYVLAGLSQNLYKVSLTRSHFHEAVLVVRSVVIATLLGTACVYMTGNRTISRLAVAFIAALSIPALTLWRMFHRRLQKKRLAKGIGVRHILIIGAGRIGLLFADHLGQHPEWGYAVQGFLDSYQTDDPRVLGSISDLRRVVREKFIDEIFISIPSKREIVKSIVFDACQMGICVNVIPDLYDGIAWRKPVEMLGEFAVRVIHREPIPEPELFVKRLMDIVGSAFGLLVLSPLFAGLSLAIKLDSAGPVFYRANRVGRKARTFRCLKFRTMVANADVIKEELRHLNEREGPFFKITEDPRISRVGKFLRKYSLDELPQLWNVLRGEMSLVGPRPHPVDDYKQYKLEHLRRLDVTPGITCLWQILARGDPSFDRALALDTQYIENWSFLLDLQILLKTIPSLIRGTGA